MKIDFHSPSDFLSTSMIFAGAATLVLALVIAIDQQARGADPDAALAVCAVGAIFAGVGAAWSIMLPVPISEDPQLPSPDRIPLPRADREVLVTIDGVDLFVGVSNYRAGTPDVHYLPNGDPGYPGDPPEFEVVYAVDDGGRILDDTALDEFEEKHADLILAEIEATMPTADDYVERD